MVFPFDMTNITIPKLDFMTLRSYKEIFLSHNFDSAVLYMGGCCIQISLNWRLKAMFIEQSPVSLIQCDDTL